MVKVKSKRGIKIFIGVLAAVAVVLVCAAFWVAKHYVYNSVVGEKHYVYNSVVGERAMVYVHRQWSAAQLDSALSEVLDAPRSVARVERLLSLLDFDAAEREGAYRVEPGMSAWQVALKLARGGQTPVRVTFNNVRTIDQLAGRIAEQLCFSKDDLLALLQNDSVCADLGFTQATLPALFLPDTYEFYWTVTPEEFLQKMKREYRRYWMGQREEQAQAWGLTPVEVATLASDQQARRDGYGGGSLYEPLAQGHALAGRPYGEVCLRRFLIAAHFEGSSRHRVALQYLSGDGIAAGPDTHRLEAGTRCGAEPPLQRLYLHVCPRGFLGVSQFCRHLERAPAQCRALPA